MPIRNITQVTCDNLHELVPEYIHGNSIIIQNYNDMKEVYLSMLRARYLFTIDRDIIIGCLTDLTYMYCPGDDVNKDAVLELLVIEEEDEEDEEDEGLMGGDIIEDMAPFVQEVKDEGGGGDGDCSNGM